MNLKQWWCKHFHSPRHIININSKTYECSRCGAIHINMIWLTHLEKPKL